MYVGQCVWYPMEMDLIKKVLEVFKDVFKVTTFATAWMPSFTTGQIGFILASKNKVCHNVIFHMIKWKHYIS